MGGLSIAVATLLAGPLPLNGKARKQARKSTIAPTPSSALNEWPKRKKSAREVHTTRRGSSLHAVRGGGGGAVWDCRGGKARSDVCSAQGIACGSARPSRAGTSTHIAAVAALVYLKAMGIMICWA